MRARHVSWGLGIWLWGCAEYHTGTAHSAAAAAGRAAPRAARSADGASAEDTDERQDTWDDTLPAPDEAWLTDAEADADPRRCRAHSRSTLPGVYIRFARDAVCRFTREEARGGEPIQYQVVVEEKVVGVGSFALNTDDCAIVGGALNFYEELLDPGQPSRAIDHSDCPEADVFSSPFVPNAITLFRGTSSRNVRWYQSEWDRPIPAGTIPGDSLAAGVYRFTVHAQGRYDVTNPDAPMGQPFAIETTVDIELVD